MKRSGEPTLTMKQNDAVRKGVTSHRAGPVSDPDPMAAAATKLLCVRVLRAPGAVCVQQERREGVVEGARDLCPLSSPSKRWSSAVTKHKGRVLL